MEFNKRNLPKADLQKRHDRIVTEIRDGDNEEILKLLEYSRKQAGTHDFTRILNYAVGRSVLYHALRTNGISVKVIQFLLENGADTNFVIRKRVHRKGHKSTQKLITAVDVALEAQQPGEILALLDKGEGDMPGAQAEATVDVAKIYDLQSDDDSDEEASAECSSDDEGGEPAPSVQILTPVPKKIYASWDCKEAAKDIAALACAVVLTPFIQEWLNSSSRPGWEHYK